MVADVHTVPRAQLNEEQTNGEISYIAALA